MESRDILDSLLNAVRDGFLFVGPEGAILSANRWIEQQYASQVPLVGKKCYTTLAGRDSPCPDCPYLTGSMWDKSIPRIFHRQSEQGTTQWFEAMVYPLTDTEGRIIGAIEHIKDITEHRQTEELLKDEIARRRILVEQSRDGIVVLDQDGAVYEANEKYATMLGYSMEEVYQLHIWDWDADYGKEELLAMLETVDAAGDHFETRHRRKDGTFYDVEISTNGAVIGERKLIFCVCRDITEKKALERQIRELAIRDPLTGVYNRRYVFERLDEMAAEYSRGQSTFCVSIIDLDNFKVINDTYGHAAGDYALREFAVALNSELRKYDLVGRYGGEEFVIVSRNARVAETVAMIGRIMATIRERVFMFDDRPIKLTFSCGIAHSSELPRDEFSLEALLSLADKRLYTAKAEGRDRYIPPHTRNLLRSR